MKKIFSLSADVMLIMAFAAVLFTIIGFLIGINWHSNTIFLQKELQASKECLNLWMIIRCI